MRSAACLVLIVGLGWFSSSFAEKPGETTPPAATKSSRGGELRISCSSAGDTRVIVKLKSGNSGCEVLYTKNGESKQVASQQIGNDHCDTVVEKMRSTLTDAGFSCR